MKTNKKVSFSRILSLVLVALMLLTALVSCGGGNNVNKPVVDTAVFLEETPLLSNEKLNDIAQMLVSTYTLDFNTQERLIAAYRGYDDPSKVDDSVLLAPNLLAAIALIDEANELADEDAKLSFTDYKATNDQGTITANINAADVRMIIKSMQTAIQNEKFEDLAEPTMLEIGQLKQISLMLADAYAKDFDTVEILLAAYRGYDMLAEDFDPESMDDTTAKEPNFLAVVALIDKANERASEDKKVFFDNYKETDENGNTIAHLNEIDLYVLIKLTQNSVSTKTFESLGNVSPLSASNLQSIATMLADAYAVDFKTQELLIAAYRGYDMLASDFDPSKVDNSVTLEPNLLAVVTLIDKANERASKETKLHFDFYKKTETKLEINEEDGSEKTTVVVTPKIIASDVELLIKSLQSTVDLNTKRGFLDTILGWVGVFIGWMTKLFGGSYIGAICLFAIIVELIMLPLSIKQQKNSIKQAKLRPKEMAIKKKYAGRTDQVTQQKMRQELQELYQRENVNPASGCLPLLLQMPIIIALYNIVIDPLRYVLGQTSALSTALHQFFTASPAAGGLGKVITDSRGTITLLSELNAGSLEGLKDFMFFSNGDSLATTVESLIEDVPNFSLFGLNFGVNPSLTPSEPKYYWLLLVPILTFVVYFFSMKLTKKFTYQSAMQQDQQTACSGWLMDIYMPGMSTFFTFIMPALVGVYWMFKSVVSTLRQYIVAKLMPYPQFTEEDYKAAEREYAGKAPRKGSASNSPTRNYGRDVEMVGGKPKSFFHMDDDDYLAKLEAERASEEQEEAERKAAGEKAAVDAGFLKKDDRPDRKKTGKAKNEDSAESEDNEKNNDEQP